MLKNMFLRERKKKAEKEEKSGGPGFVYTPQWKWYTAMSFLEIGGMVNTEDMISSAPELVEEVSNWQ